MNVCVKATGGCGHDFATTSLFDKHRVGEHNYTLSQGLRRELPVENGRRCLTIDEMEEKGWTTDAHGRWRGAPGNYRWGRLSTESKIS